MKPVFATTGNVERFLSAFGQLERRGAPEASMMLVTGEAGHGKSRTVQWFAAQQGGIYLRAKAAWTPHWMLREVVSELGQQPERHNEGLFSQALKPLAADPRPLVIDEIEHALHDSKCLETVRDLSDLTEIPVILVGMEGVTRRLQRYPQLSSRVTQTVTFGALTVEDVQAVLGQICEVETANGAAEEIYRQTGGFIRELMDAIAETERTGGRLGRPVTGEDLRQIKLTGGRATRTGRAKCRPDAKKPRGR